MSLLSGAVSFVELSVPVDTEFYEDKVKSLAFKDIDDTYDDHSIGWVSPLDMFNSDSPALVLGDCVVLTLRIDERKAPGALLKRLVAKEERRIRIERQVPKLSGGMRIEIKERIRTELVRKTKPTTVTVDAVWSVNTGQILLFSVSPSVLEIFEDFFKVTFGSPPELVVQTGDPSDFLAWCWWQSEFIKPYGRMSIGEGPELQVVCPNGPEAFKALSLGKSIEQAHVIVDGYGNGTLSSGMVFKGFKLPKGETAETDDGAILERIFLVSALLQAVKEEYQAYLDEDTSGLMDWVLEQERADDYGV